MIELTGIVLDEIINGKSDEYKVIDEYYKFIDCDHDLWEFQAILYRYSDSKFFSVNWYDNYACNWEELGLLDDIFELIEVFPKEKLMTVYENN